MKFVADFHLHSHYSRATSKNLNFEHLSKWAQLKGVQVVGTGDIERAVSGVLTNLYQTIAIVLVVVIAFLGLRSGLIVGAMIPLTMLLRSPSNGRCSTSRNCGCATSATWRS